MAEAVARCQTRPCAREGVEGEARPPPPADEFRPTLFTLLRAEEDDEAWARKRALEDTVGSNWTVCPSMVLME